MKNECRRSVAVVDVGSNTIKLLVAGATDKGKLSVLHEARNSTRIGTGIGSAQPELTEEHMQAGTAAIESLLNEAAAHNPGIIRMVATGAVRDASNGNDFAKRVLSETGHALAILSGEEEAAGIAAGLVTDPSLADKSDFLACDLGGGSLELILVENRSVRAKVSLPLGAIRLTERFINDPEAQLDEMELHDLDQHVNETLSESSFPSSVEVDCVVATGGAFVAARTILAEREGIPFQERSLITQCEIAEIFSEIIQLTLPQRIECFPALPPSRADVMPAALACMLSLLDYLQANKVRHSLHNLRYGESARLLGIVG